MSKVNKKIRRRRKEYSKELDDYLLEYYPTTPTKDIAKIHKKKPRQIRYRASKLGIKKTSDFRVTMMKEISHSRSDIFTKKTIEEIGKKYPSTPTKDLANKYGKSIQSIRGLAHRQGWKKEKLW